MKNPKAIHHTLSLSLLLVALGACTSQDESDEASSPASDSTTSAQNSAAAPPPFAFQSPESVSVYGENWIVSNVGAELKPTSKDGDGQLLLVPQGGDLKSAQIIGANTTLHAPKGTLVIGDTLYVVDIDTLHSFDLKTRQHQQAIKPHEYLPERAAPQFLNAIAQGDNGNLYVSATDTSDIYIIHPGEQVRVGTLALNTPLKGPNGLVWDKQQQRLYVAEWGTDNQPNGRLGYIEMKGEPPYDFTVLGEHTGYLDGLQKAGEHLYFSDWVAFEKAGKVHRYHLEAHEQTSLNSDPIAGPANFQVSADGSELIVPNMLGNQLSTIPLAPLSTDTQAE